ncbi:CBS domain-containing protein [Streptomyces sp. TRM76130]|nr:CBS domain-containing protein [Streptomyces sp. TRM76130]
MTPGVVAVRPGASLVEAARLMRDHGIGGVVVADGQRVVGMLTARDITVRAMAEGVDPLTVDADAVCTRDPPVVAPGLPVRDALALMRERAVTRLPVVENGLPVGLVSRGDLDRRTRAEAAGPRT